MTDDSRPVLKPKVRLRFDAITQSYLLLSPERGLLLSQSAIAVVRLCTGRETVAGLVSQLAMRHPDCSPAVLREDVLGFLHSLERRGLLCEGAA